MALTAIESLKQTDEIRFRCNELLEIGERGNLKHFDVQTERLDKVAERVVEVTKSRYTDLNIPLHSRWRHFEVSGINRWLNLVKGVDAKERTRIAIDLVIPSVLLDAGAGSDWQYFELSTQLEYSRSEGLAVASFEMFVAGAFSSDPSQPLRTDADALTSFNQESLREYFQVSDSNRLTGLEGRTQLLQSLGQAIATRPELFGEAVRLGNLFDYVVETMRPPSAQSILALLLELLKEIWPQRIVMNGENLGDVWRHSLVRRQDESDRLVPFHKLTQWLTYSLIEPFEQAGMPLTNTDSLTGLAEYRNGGLFVDLDVLKPRDKMTLTETHSPDSEVIVEWRALTLALLEKLYPLLQETLGRDESEFTMGAMLEGGTWAAGRQLAADRRPNAEPPIRVESNGTLF